MRLGIPVRQGPAGLRPLWSDTHVVGPARPVRHLGSVDVFLEALEGSVPGDVLVVDDGGRADRACVGDLVTLEAQRAGMTGIVIWGLHRDTRELRSIRLPVYSSGAVPAGPSTVAERDDAPVRVGESTVSEDDVVLADDDGILFLPRDRAADIAAAAAMIRDTERLQAARMRLGEDLRTQLRFAEYLTARDRDGTTFRDHLKGIDGAVEV